MDNKYVPGTGPLGAKLMIIGEAPFYEELQAGKPFVGPSGRELDKLLREANINRSDCWITNACKYFVPANIGKEKIPFGVRAARSGINMTEQLEHLQNEINEIKPNCVLALGNSALKYVTGKDKIGNFRGSILHGMGVKVVGSYHPAHLLHGAKSSEIKGYWNRQVIIFDLKRALAQSQFPDLRLPVRNLEICTSSAQLADFRDKYRGQIPAVDIEAGGHCLPVCIGLAYNRSHGMCVPLWNTDGMCEMPDSDLIQCWLILDEILSSPVGVIGQNFNYDRDKIKRIGFMVRKIVSDTMYKAFAINPEFPKGLAFNTSIYTEEPYYKDEGMYEGTYRDLFLGCARDSCVTKEIDENMEADIDAIGQRKFYENYLMKLPDMYWKIEKQGFSIDTDSRDKLIRKYVAWDEKIRYRLFQLVGTEVNVNSNTRQIPYLLWEVLKLPRKDSTGEEALTELLNSPKTQENQTVVEILELILEGRRVRKTISTSILALPDYDGRLRTTYFPCLETGRSSTGQQEAPIRPSIELRDFEGKKKKRSLGFAFQTMTKHGDIGADVREMFLP